MSDATQYQIEQLKRNQVLIRDVNVFEALVRHKLVLLENIFIFYFQQKFCQEVVVLFGNLLADDHVWDLMEVKVKLVKHRLRLDPSNETLKNLKFAVKDI